MVSLPCLCFAEKQTSFAQVLICRCFLCAMLTLHRFLRPAVAAFSVKKNEPVNGVRKITATLYSLNGC